MYVHTKFASIVPHLCKTTYMKMVYILLILANICSIMAVEQKCSSFSLQSMSIVNQTFECFLACLSSSCCDVAVIENETCSFIDYPYANIQSACPSAKKLVHISINGNKTEHDTTYASQEKEENDSVDWGAFFDYLYNNIDHHYYNSYNDREYDCATHFDAITRTSDGAIYAFANSLVYKFSTFGLELEWPKLIDDVFQGLPSDIDAALYNWNDEENIYFFKGNSYWMYTDFDMRDGYPQLISNGWQGVPNNIDAAFRWGRNGNTYFFKGEVYYRYDDEENKVMSGYPYLIEPFWGGLPGNLSASLQDIFGTTYMFYEDDFYKYDDVADRPCDNYPQAVGKYWCTC